MELDNYAQLVEEVTARVDDDGDLSVLDQFFVWDGDWNLLHEMPLCEAYAIVKLVIRSGYDFRVRGFSIFINIFPHTIFALFHCGMKFRSPWHMWPYSITNSFINSGCHVLTEGTTEFVKSALSICKGTVGKVLEVPFSDCCMVEYSFVITILIER